jgi:hypothetical protein
MDILRELINRKYTKQRNSGLLIMGKRMISVITLIVLVLIIIISPSAETMSWHKYINFNDSYTYTVTPEKTPEIWEKFTSLSEMIAACQIPDSLLQGMSTEGLIESCIQYPLYGNIVFYNSPLLGFRKMVSQFNGLHELYNRDDLPEKLISIYLSLDFHSLLVYESHPKVRLKWLELFFTEEGLLEKMSFDQRTVLIKALYNNINIINDRYIQYFDVMTEIIIIGKILQIDSPEFASILNDNERMSKFISTGSCLDISGEWDEMLSEINRIIEMRLGQ